MNHYKSLIIIGVIVSIFFFPALFQNRIILNGNFLVSFYAPWKARTFTNYPAGVPAKQGGGYDQLRLGFPYFSQIWNAWREYRLPLWNPYNFSGLPLAAEPQSAAFYPLHSLAYFLPDTTIWNIFLISGFFLAYIFMYAFLWDLTKDYSSSLLGGFLFSFSTFFIVWTQEVVTAQHAALYLPLILLALRRFYFEKVWWFVLLAAIVLSILSGYIQITVYVLLTAALYFFWHLRERERKTQIKILILTILATIFACSLTAYQLLPLQEMNSYSSRDNVNMTAFLEANLLPWQSLIQLLIPEFFGSSGTWNHYGYPQGTFYEHMYAVALPGFLFALYAIFYRRRNTAVIFFLTVLLLSLIFSLNSPLSKIIFHLKIPIFSSSIANRVLFLPGFCLASLAALGIKAWKEDKDQGTRRMQILLISILVFLIMLLFWVYRMKVLDYRPFGFPKGWAVIALRNSTIPTISVTLFLLLLIFSKGWKQIRTKLLIFTAFTLSILQMAYFSYKVITFTETNFVYPNDDIFAFLKEKAKYGRFWGFGDAFIESNLATQMKVYSPEGYDSLADRRYAQLLYSVGNNGSWTEQISRSDATINKHTVDKSFMTDMARRRLLSLLSVDYILFKTLPDTKPHEKINDYLDPTFYPLVATESGISIYRNLQSLPRAYFASQAISKSSAQDILDTLFDPSFDLTTTAMIEAETFPETRVDPESNVEIIKYFPERVEIKTKSSTPQWLILTDTFYPGWEADIDDSPAPIYRAQFALRALFVPPGKHEVVFRYLPKPLRLGLHIAFGSLIFLLLGTILGIKWKKLQQELEW